MGEVDLIWTSRDQSCEEPWKLIGLATWFAVSKDLSASLQVTKCGLSSKNAELLIFL